MIADDELGKDGKTRTMSSVRSFAAESMWLSLAACWGALCATKVHMYSVRGIDETLHVAAAEMCATFLLVGQKWRLTGVLLSLALLTVLALASILLQKVNCGCLGVINVSARFKILLMSGMCALCGMGLSLDRRLAYNAIAPAHRAVVCLAALASVALLVSSMGFARAAETRPVPG